MTTERIVRVSPHLLMDVHSCETKAWARHVLGYTSKSDAIKMVAGQAFHKAMEVMFDPTTLFGYDHREDRAAHAIEAMHDIYDAAWQRLAADQLDPSLTPQNLDRILRRWIEMHPPAMLPWRRVIAVEEAFVSREWVNRDVLGGNMRIQLIVRPDLVVEDFDGKVRWVDTKTTGWHITDSGWKKALRMSLQTQLYSDAIVQRYSDAAIYGGWINAIELRKLPGEPDAAPKLKKDGTPAKPRTCAEHKVPYSECGNEHAKTEFIECLTTPEKVAAALRDAEGAAFRFALHTTQTTGYKMNTIGTANGTCRFCPMMDWCDSGRIVEALEYQADLVLEPWPIETGRRAS